ncbi:DUF3048 domain-containing protein [Yinghuangia seranimata]|uniref:DUF3048 domain-containing protein n=1 Tax=Yinghuangia seranimata TaxID=408067 RepID=UPI00248BAE61|nr:DUF3048 domain-containing protein [Yinghuangia seranimata]MDI2130866.1 DUF3048 domain-containing protein [Yinghuangia seranimata]
MTPWSWFRGLDRGYRAAVAAGLALIVVGATVLGLVLGGGGSSGSSKGSDGAGPVAVTPEAPTPAAPAPAGPNPLTGEADPAGKLLAVKIDNVGSTVQKAQAGLNSADIVYAIQVEGGLSRLMAVYDSNHVPASVGPVRSARQTDLPILAAYGKVDFAYSGAIGGLKPELAAANIFNVTPFTYKGFSHGGTDPTFINPADVFAKFPDADVAKDIGLRFAADVPPGGTPADSVTVRMPSSSFGFAWNGSEYLVSTDGHAAVTDGGQRDTTTNVIVQHVAVVPGKFTDFNAGHPDNEVFSVTTGSGTVDIYRNGQVYHGTWSKPTDTSPTTYSVDGAPFNLQPGRTWIVLSR